MAEPVEAASKVDAAQNGAGDAAALAMPPKRPGVVVRRKEPVIQLSTRVRISLKDLLDEYHLATGSSIQDTIDVALVAFFRKIGWITEEGQE